MGEANSEKSLVPRLRFQKFSEEWRTHQMGEIAEIFKGKGIAKSDIRNDGIHPCIRYGELYTVYGELVTEVVSRTSLPAMDLFFGESNDVIIPSSGETKEDIATAACVIPGGIAFGSDLNVLRTKENGVFLSYCLNGPLRKGIARVAQGDSVVHLYPHQIEKLPIAIPVRSEQQKIADCLSSLDELITVETQKLTTLKTHKKGLMQQLFPREGETVPRLRFPEFQEAGEWVPKTIGDSCESFSGGTPSTTNKSFYGGKIPFIRSAEIDKGGTELCLTNEGLENSAAKMVRVGDVLVALYGANSGDVALAKINGAINQAILCLRHETNNTFVYQYLAHRKEWIITTFIQGGQGNLSGEIIKAIRLCFPKPKEQQRIADCLSSLGDLITSQSQKIDALKRHKKGLMQQLFPVLDEAQV